MWDLIYMGFIYLLCALLFVITVVGVFGFMHFIYLGIKDITQSDTKKSL